MELANITQFEARKIHSERKPSLISLQLNAIKPFEHNPRITRNPEYERLFTSIEKNGLEQPLLVAKKPDEANYTLHAGGNTRLQILQELVEIGDERFETVPCIVYPWVSDAHALIAHLRETEMHGSLQFIERAKAVLRVGELYKHKHSDKALTQRGLANLLCSSGYPLSQAMISHMDYAVNRLYPHMPVAFDHGLGKNRVTKIRNLETAANRIWNRQLSEQEYPFDDVFNALCARHDAADWDIDTFEASLNYELSVAFELDQNVARIMVAEEQFGRRVLPVHPSYG